MTDVGGPDALVPQNLPMPEIKHEPGMLVRLKAAGMTGKIVLTMPQAGS